MAARLGAAEPHLRSGREALVDIMNGLCGAHKHSRGHMSQIAHPWVKMTT